VDKGRELIWGAHEFVPLELWRYGAQTIVLYRPAPGAAFRLCVLFGVDAGLGAGCDTVALDPFW